MGSGWGKPVLKYQHPQMLGLEKARVDPRVLGLSVRISEGWDLRRW